MSSSRACSETRTKVRHTGERRSGSNHDTNAREIRHERVVEDVASVRRMRIPTIALLAALGGASPGLAADSVETFYKGKTMQLLIGFGPGGGYDLYGRAVARHLGRFIPGNPAIVPQNMAGAGSVRAASSLYNAAPKDGTVIGTFSRGIIVDTLLGANKGQFEAQNFGWLGSVTNEVSVCGFSRSSGIRTWDDMLTRDTTVGSSGQADDLGVYANVLRSVFNAKLKLISGYPGTADILLAVERGELGGLCGWSWSSLKSRSKKLYDSGRDRGAGSARADPARGPAQRAADHEIDQGSGQGRGARADLLAPDPGAPVRRAAGHSGRALARLAHGLRRHHEGQGVPGGSREARSRGAAGLGRGDRRAGREL